MVPHRTVLIDNIQVRPSKVSLGRLALLLALWGSFLHPRLIAQQKTKPLTISVGTSWTRYVMPGGYGLSAGLVWGKNEILLGGEIDGGTSGGALAYRRYLSNPLGRVAPFAGMRFGSYYDTFHLGLYPTFSLNLHFSIGVKVAIWRSLFFQLQSGVGATSFRHLDGTPRFSEAWIAMRMLHLGIGLDIPVRTLDGTPLNIPIASAPTQTTAERFEMLAHIGAPVNFLRLPTVNRIMLGSTFLVTRQLAFSLRYQAVTIQDSTMVGKVVAGLRWYPQTISAPKTRYAGSIEIGYFGPVLNNRAPLASFGFVLGQHLQWPLLRWAALDFGLQYALLKTPDPRYPTTSDFEVCLGLSLRPWLWRK